MAKSLLEQLPKIVADGKAQAEKILEGLESRHRVRLQTREWVLPSKDASETDWIAANTRQQALSAAQDEMFGAVQGSLGDAAARPWQNRLIYGDNLLAMAALLAGDEHTPSLRGKVDLIYIDPPFDSKADYRTKVRLPGVEIEQRPTVMEQLAYSDTWSGGTATYLETIVPRLLLMRELLVDSGAIYVHLDWHVAHYVKITMDELFGKENLEREVIWSFDTKSGYKSTADNWVRSHDTLLYWAKSKQSVHFTKEYLPYDAEYLKRFKKLDEYGRAYRDDRGSGVKQYLDELKGVAVSDVWSDIKSFQQDATSAEYLGYATQKPTSLLA
ncbi:MAG: site-specific DNA-methyltransferase, partial [Xanthomonadaceae bacterium]|nr:site-specific DNA-methyltransferase [Xanthomonadaceae bacterium]